MSRNATGGSPFSIVAVAIAVVALTGCGSSKTSTGASSTTTSSPSSSTPTSVHAGSTTTPVPTTAPTPTTNPYPWKGEPVMSASFVSARQGWALETNGRIDPTTDEGASWGSTGVIDLRQYREVPTRIRFADATHGFVFNRDALYGSTDAGASWKRLSPPFSNVYDLAISGGTVYAVAFQQSDATFRIWSSPADNLSWTKDPLGLHPGAGPVPTIQLVFAHGSGWLIEVDRTVVSGARLTANGHWVTWKPPCLDTNGPAELTASTSTDLVASCNEHVWGGGPITPAVYVSRDGGVTFHRHAAPSFGLVASPSPGTAVVVYGDKLQRTTDDGATWAVATDAHQNHTFDAKDFGFTTTTQGFAILGNGMMLMTHDAGATWKQVIRP